MIEYHPRRVKDMARKTYTSTEVKTRWKQKNYKQYVVSLRYDTDQELIDFMEDNKDKLGTTNIFRDALAMYVEAEKKSED